MKANKSVKRYWGRTGPASVFGPDWKDRKDFSDGEAEQRFNEVWKDHLHAAVQSARTISANRAKELIPEDGRRNFFDPEQEHRQFLLGGKIASVKQQVLLARLAGDHIPHHGPLAFYADRTQHHVDGLG